jgi:hypothetical protein
LELISCSFDILGRINPQIQTEFQNRATAKIPLIELLRKEIKKTKNLWAAVKENITEYVFKEGE